MGLYTAFQIPGKSWGFDYKIVKVNRKAKSIGDHLVRSKLGILKGRVPTNQQMAAVYNAHSARKTAVIMPNPE